MEPVLVAGNMGVNTKFNFLNLYFSNLAATAASHGKVVVAGLISNSMVLKAAPVEESKPNRSVWVIDIDLPPPRIDGTASDAPLMRYPTFNGALTNELARRPFCTRRIGFLVFLLIGILNKLSAGLNTKRIQGRKRYLVRKTVFS